MGGGQSSETVPECDAALSPCNAGTKSRRHRGGTEEQTDPRLSYVTALAPAAPRYQMFCIWRFEP